MLKIEMLSTGDEVLYGQITDTNSAWLADTFFNSGYPLTLRITAGDDLAQLVTVLQDRAKVADILIVNGGLGPTQDDLTIEAAALANGKEKLILHSHWVNVMQRYFDNRGISMPQSNLKQAMLPESATLIHNSCGTACGFRMKIGHCEVFFTPGVPFEFKEMISHEILPYIQRHYPLTSALACLRLSVIGCSESQLSDRFSSLRLPKHYQLGFRAAMPFIEIKLTGPQESLDEVTPIWQSLRATLEHNIVSENGLSVSEALSHKLNEMNCSMATIEVASAGQLSHQLIKANAPLIMAMTLDPINPPVNWLTQHQQWMDEYPDSVILSIPENTLPVIKIALGYRQQFKQIIFNCSASVKYKPTYYALLAGVAQFAALHFLSGTPIVCQQNEWLTLLDEASH